MCFFSVLFFFLSLFIPSDSSPTSSTGLGTLVLPAFGSSTLATATLSTTSSQPLSAVSWPLHHPGASPWYPPPQHLSPHTHLLLFLLSNVYIKKKRKLTPPTDSQDATTPEYAEFEEYPDNTLYPDGQEEEEEEEEDDYPLTSEDLEFHSPPGGGAAERPDSLPATPSAVPPAPVGEGLPPMTSEPRLRPEQAERQYAPANPPERGAPEQQQPQVRCDLVISLE